MAKYLIQAGYSSEGLKGVMKEGGTGRRSAIEAGAKSLGFKVEALYFAFGEGDIIAVVDAPDNMTMASFALLVGGTGALSSYRTTVLLTPEEIDQAAKKASAASYRAPGS